MTAVADTSCVDTATAGARGVIEAALWRGLHVTTCQAAASIDAEGFRIGRGESGHAGAGSPIWGDGVYMALDDPTADLYSGNARMVCEARLQRVLVFNYGNGREALRDKQVITYAAGEMASIIPAELQAVLDERPSWLPQGWSPGRATYEWATRKGIHRELHRLLPALGFDGLCILEDAPSYDAGGNQLVVFDPKLVRAI